MMKNQLRSLLFLVAVASVPEALCFQIIFRQESPLSRLSPRRFWRQKSHEGATIEKNTTVNGEDLFAKLEETKASLPDNEMLPEAPPLLYDKYLTMQDKRIVVTIRYSGGAGLKPYFLTVAKKIKLSHPDVILERRILPTVENVDSEAVFEVIVDGRVVVGNGRFRKQRVGNVDMAHGRSVFVSMQELDLAISRARRNRRPTSVYGEDEQNPESIRLEMLRRNKEAASSETKD